MLVSLTVFSQKDTRTTITDSIVSLPKNVAREVVKDIIKLDSCNAELNIAKKNNELLQKNSDLKDSIITSKDNQIILYGQKEKNYETMLVLKDAQKQNLENSIKFLNTELKRTKRNLVKTKIGAGAIVAFLVYIIIK
jgi:hypothetical protein